MKKNKLEEFLTQEMANELLEYDALTGELSWKERDIKWFSEDGLGSRIGNAKRWNVQNAGKPALNSINKQSGQKAGALLGIAVSSHKIIFFMHYGTWPETIVHKNSDKSDNRLENLAESSKASVVRRRGVTRKNTSGASGVHQVAKTGKWSAVINLGSFDTLEEATAKRKWADEIWDYHKNHGRKQTNAN